MISHHISLLSAALCSRHWNQPRIGILLREPITLYHDLTLIMLQVGLLNAGSVLGRLLPNIFADKIGPYNMLLPCLFMSSALAFAMMGIKNFTGVAVFAILYGFWSGSCMYYLSSSAQ